MPAETVAVVGGGQAAVEVAFTLRKKGFDGRVVVVTEEPTPPYQRPPLSKGYLLGKAEGDSLLLRPERTYTEAGVELVLERRVTAFDTPAQVLELDDGSTLRYDHVALTVGGRPRRFEPLDDRAYDNVHYLRSRADSDRLNAAFREGGRVVIIGGGYIGLEIAAAAVAMGLDVTVVEAMPRLLARVTAPHMSQFYEQVHRSNGVRILTDTSVSHGVAGERTDTIDSLVLHTGEVLAADIVVVGIGLVPNAELAAAAGLAVAGGIVVDDQCRTSDPRVLAAGDCTAHPSPLHGGQLARVESVSNAVEQGRVVAGTILGEDARHRSIPWFWSDQYDLKLQMVGRSTQYDHSVIRGEPDERSFTTFYIDHEGVLIGVDAVNRPADFLWSRRLVSAGVRTSVEALQDPSVPLKSLLPE